MDLQDARKLSSDAQERLRLTAVKWVVEEKKTQTETAKLLGVSRFAVFKWLQTYSEQGLKGLLKKKRGRRSEEMSRLSSSQCQQIIHLIKDHCPDQLKLPFMLWTREAVGQLIENTYQIKLSVRTVGNYLKRWGFTVQKPLRQAYERQEEHVRLWLEKTYPMIVKKAKKEKAEIQWGDETGFRSSHQTGTTYSPRGQKPVVKGAGKNFGANMISSITNFGKLRFMLYEETFKTEVFLTFLRRLIYKAPQKIYLILDNHKVHHAKRVQKWIEKHQDKIQLFFLPSYSPDLNPDELLNQDVKANAVGRNRPRTLKEMMKNVRRYLYKRQKMPQVIQAYFSKNEVSYAA